MQWVVDNWLILLLVGGMLAMHLFGHGHGGHGGGRGGHGRGGRNKSDSHVGHGHEPHDSDAADNEDKSPAPERRKDDGQS